MTREHMTPPDSGRAIRPGQDCPNCGSRLNESDGRKTCSGGCGHSHEVRR